MIGYGIVGVGGFARVWRQSLAVLEGEGVARLRAAVVRDPGKYAAEVAELRAGGCAVYGTLAEMLSRARGEVDVVGIPTGIAQHVPLAVEALDAGYNVFVEKPVAATVQEVEALRRAVQRSGCWCAVGFQFLYSPTMQWLRGKLRSGRLGRLHEAHCRIGWPRSTAYYERNGWAGQLQQGGHWVLDGPATNATAHYLTNLLYLAAARGDEDARIATVRAELYRARDIPSYDTSCLEVTLAGGARLLHYATHALEEAQEPVMDITCEGGSIHWEAEGNTAAIHYADGQEERFRDDDPARLHVRPFAQVARVAAGEEPAPLCTLAEAAPHVLAVDLAFESSGGVTSIPTPFVYERMAADGAALACVREMGATLRAAYGRGVLFSDLGVPWAVPGVPVAAEGYTHFPRSEALRRALGGAGVCA